MVYFVPGSGVPLSERTVDIANKTCTCGMWQYVLLPLCVSAADLIAFESVLIIKILDLSRVLVVYAVVSS